MVWLNFSRFFFPIPAGLCFTVVRLSERLSERLFRSCHCVSCPATSIWSQAGTVCRSGVGMGEPDLDGPAWS
ncbi:hypothetical protein BJX63DRAFT_415225 [Aspergillus granulosus]|uniref:Secreted protein n=1 Tax=Aspergillus granulosus TaxID=176169 RepID=A0ABR4GV40_9EURO